MKKRLIQFILLSLWCAIFNIPALFANEPGSHQNSKEMATQQGEHGIWEKSKALGSSAVKNSRSMGSAVAKKSGEIYQAVKEKGSAMGETIADISKRIWNKTKQFGATVVEKSKAAGTAIADKTKSLYHKTTKSTQSPETAVTEKQI